MLLRLLDLFHACLLSYSALCRGKSRITSFTPSCKCTMQRQHFPLSPFDRVESIMLMPRLTVEKGRKQCRSVNQR